MILCTLFSYCLVDLDFLSVDVTFNIIGPPDQIICHSVDIFQDERIETTEKFTVELNTNDSMVLFTTREAQIFIIDTDSEESIVSL